MNTYNKVNQQKILEIGDRLNARYNELLAASEEQIKTSIILPLFEAIGYDTFDPLIFKAEHDLLGQKIDYMVDMGNIALLVECKKLSQNLDKMGVRGNICVNQLSRYFNCCDIETKIGILTNGDIWRFFKSERGTAQQMCKEPFYEFRLSKLLPNDLYELAEFAQENIQTWKSAEDTRLISFRNKVKELMLDIKRGSMPQFLKETLAAQVGINTLEYPDIINSIIADEAKAVFDEHTEPEEDYYEICSNSLDDLHLETLEDVESEDTAENTDDTVSQKNDIEIGKEYIFTSNPFKYYSKHKLKYAILYGTHYDNISTRGLLCRVIESIIDRGPNYRELVLKACNSTKGNYRVIPGKTDAKEFCYLEKYDISVYVKSSSETIFKFIQKLFHGFGIDPTNLIVCFR